MSWSKKSVFLSVLVALSVGRVFGASVPEALAYYRARAPKSIKVPASAAFIAVLPDRQLMLVDLGGGTSVVYRVSTAQAGLGAQANSDRTPTGWHRVKERIGGKAKIGQLFRSRALVPGKVLPESSWREKDGDKVLSRILWLEGLEPGVNKDPKGNYDSYLRHIYIHGTNQEQLLGTPSSHGCIRMGNRDVVRLFDSLKSFGEVYVLIVDPPPKTVRTKGKK